MPSSSHIWPLAMGSRPPSASMFTQVRIVIPSYPLAMDYWQYSPQLGVYQYDVRHFGELFYWYLASGGLWLVTGRKGNMYETGSRNPKSDFWIAAAQKYGSTIDYPMGFSNAQKKPSESKNPPPSSRRRLKKQQRTMTVQTNWGSVLSEQR